MKKFITYIFSISLSIVLMMYFFDVIYTQTYTQSNPRTTLQYILKTKNIDYDVVFLGSSRVASHIDTKLYESLSNTKAINLGVVGTTLNDALLQLNLFINNNSVSKVFLQIDSNYNYENSSMVMTSEAMPFLNNKIIKSHFKKYNEDFNSLYYMPFYRYNVYGPKIGFREAFFSIFNKEPMIDPSIGFVPKYGSDISKQWVLPYTILNKNLVLEEITNICKENNIELILYASPYCSKIVNKDYIGKLKNKIPNLIDLSTGYEDDLFYDCRHLNIQGAKIFTENLYYVSTKKDL